MGTTFLTIFLFRLCDYLLYAVLMRILKFYISLILMLNLAGCATVHEQQPVSLNQTTSWQQRQIALMHLQNWDISAVMAMRTHAGNEGGTANLKWQQHQQDYSIMLYGPLGADTTKIYGRPGRVFLETADGKKFDATTPELLLAQQTGWQLPVSDLYYWIRGLPAQGSPRRMQFDASHHLTQLNQSGWRIDYLRYSTVNQIDVPTKLTLENIRLKIKIVINQWQI